MIVAAFCLGILLGAATTGMSLALFVHKLSKLEGME